MSNPVGVTNILQADTGFRSGTDALLLAAFALQCVPKCRTFVELGVGSGMVSCLFAASVPTAHGVGIDSVASLIALAKSNAYNAELQERLAFMHGDVRDKKCLRALQHENILNNKPIELVIANPPYYKFAHGRVSKDAQKAEALHQDVHTLQAFCTAAYTVLAHHGHFCCIYEPTHMAELFQALQNMNVKKGLGIRRILPIHTRPKQKARWILLEARKDAATHIDIDSPLTLYADESSDRICEEARTFCPWLVVR